MDINIRKDDLMKKLPKILINSVITLCLLFMAAGYFYLGHIEKKNFAAAFEGLSKAPGFTEHVQAFERANGRKVTFTDLKAILSQTRLDTAIHDCHIIAKTYAEHYKKTGAFPTKLEYGKSPWNDEYKFDSKNQQIYTKNYIDDEPIAVSIKAYL